MRIRDGNPELAGIDVAIIGAGPIGLSAALQCKVRGLRFVVLEARDEMFASVEGWKHVKMFSAWKHNVDEQMKRYLDDAGGSLPDDDTHLSGGEFIERALTPVAIAARIGEHTYLDHRVQSVTREDFDKTVTTGRDESRYQIRGVHGEGTEWCIPARHVIDCSGTWDTPNPAGFNGAPALGEQAAAPFIDVRMPDILGSDRVRYAGRRVAVLGSGHSAIGNLLSLVQLKEGAPDTEIFWLVRSSSLYRSLGGGESDELEERGKLGIQIRALVESGVVSLIQPFRVHRIVAEGNQLTLHDAAGGSLNLDRLIVATGFRPDFSFLREVRTEFDPAIECPTSLAELIDPNVHFCGSVRPHGVDELSHPDSGFFICGMKSYGRAPTFLLMTGYEQVRSIVAHIAGDTEAAVPRNVGAPGTGVCSSDAVYGQLGCLPSAKSNCC